MLRQGQTQMCSLPDPYNSLLIHPLLGLTNYIYPDHGLNFSEYPFVFEGAVHYNHQLLEVSNKTTLKIRIFLFNELEIRYFLHVVSSPCISM